MGVALQVLSLFALWMWLDYGLDLITLWQQDNASFVITLTLVTFYGVSCIYSGMRAKR